MSEAHEERSELDHISNQKSNILNETKVFTGYKTNYIDDKKSSSMNNPEQNVARNVPNASNRDSGISGSSNESVSQISSPVEDEMKVKNGGGETNNAYDAT